MGDAFNIGHIRDPNVHDRRSDRAGLGKSNEATEVSAYYNTVATSLFTIFMRYLLCSQSHNLEKD